MTLSLSLTRLLRSAKFHPQKPTITKMSTKADLENAKQLAAHRAVDEWVNDNGVIGIGSGSTIVYAVQRLAKRVAEGLNVTCVPTSYQARQLILQNQLKLSDLEQHPNLDVTIDGADEVDADMVLIKGGGGCMLQEKIVASCSEKLIIVADYTKNSQQLGENYKKGIPLEVTPMAFLPISRRIEAILGGKVKLRSGFNKAGPVVTDNGNFVLDWVFDTNKKYDWPKVNLELILMPGVVETGLFINMAKKVYFGMPDGTIKTQDK